MISFIRNIYSSLLLSCARKTGLGTSQYRQGHDGQFYVRIKVTDPLYLELESNNIHVGREKGVAVLTLTASEYKRALGRAGGE